MDDDEDEWLDEEEEDDESDEEEEEEEEDWEPPKDTLADRALRRFGTGDERYEYFGTPTPWIEVPYTRGDDSAAQSNRAVIQASIESGEVAREDVRIDMDAVYFNVHTTNETLIDYYLGLRDYPYLDDDAHSELVMELQNDAWEEHVYDEFMRALDKQFEVVADYASFDEFIPVWGAYEIINEWGDIDWHEETGGYFHMGDVADLLSDQFGFRGQYDEPEELLAELGASVFANRAWEAKNAFASFLRDFVGAEVSEWSTDEQLLSFVNTLYDLGYQLRNATGADGAPEELEQDPSIQRAMAVFDENPEAEAWYQYLGERWIALMTLRDGGEFAGSEGEEGFVEWLKETEPYWRDQRAEVYYGEPEYVDPIEHAEREGLIGLDGYAPTEGYYLRRDVRDAHAEFEGPFDEDEARVALLLRGDPDALTGEQIDALYALHTPAVQYLTDGEIAYLREGSEQSGDFMPYQRQIHEAWYSYADDPAAWLHATREAP